MARRLREHEPRRPSDRFAAHVDPARPTFYPNEVATALAIESIDYAQLRTFYKIIRVPSADKEAIKALGQRWSRFTFTDMACLVMALEACGGLEALEPGQRLRTKGLSGACSALARQGFAVPLLEVRLKRVGRRMFADVDGILVDPVTGQLAIDEVAAQTNENYFNGEMLRDRRLASALKAEVRRFRRDVEGRAKSVRSPGRSQSAAKPGMES